MRELDGTWAFLAGLAGFGYVYVGRIAFAISLLVGTVALLAILCWTRLILDPGVAYAFIAVGIALTLLQIVHPVLIAVRQKQVAARRYNRWWFYVLWLLVGAFAGDLLMSHRGPILGYETFRIPGASMAPTFEPGDVIMVDTWHYRSHEPAVGDLVVFQAETGIEYVKRIVGTPGDDLEVRDGVLYRNQRAVEEPYLHVPVTDRPYGRDVAPIELRASEYYVLGDFRDNSRDSRIDGPISRDQLRGRVEYIVFSFLNGAVQWQRFPRSVSEGT